MKNPLLSIIIPSYNDAHILSKSLPDFIVYLNNEDINFEIIVVDDGSLKPELTQSVSGQFNCRYFAHEKNLGKGAAIRKGALNAKGDYVVYTDVDIPFGYQSVKLFLKYLDSKEFDMVVGDRTFKESQYYKKISFVRQLGSNVFSFIVGRFVAGGYFDTQCGLKGFRREVSDDLFSHARINSFAFDVELLYISLKRNYDIKRLPVKLRSNEGSSVKVFRHGLGMLFDVLKIRYNYFLGRYEGESMRLYYVGETALEKKGAILK